MLAHQQPNGFTALHPGDLVASDVLGGVTNQVAIREPAGVLQGVLLIADLLPCLLAQEVAQYTDAMLVHARHDVLECQLQRPQRLHLPFGPQAAAVAQPLAGCVAWRVQVRLLHVQRPAGSALAAAGPWRLRFA